MDNQKIGALWSKKTSEGKDYFSGVISDLRGEIQIVVFRNEKKANKNQPDYDILLSEPKAGRTKSTGWEDKRCLPERRS